MDEKIKKQKAEVALVCSSGGHLAQIHKIFTKEVIGKHSSILITESVSKKRDTIAGEFYFTPLKLNPFKNFIAMLKLLRLFRKLKTKIVITTGADLGTMAMIAGKLAGAKTIFIETIIRVKKPTLTGLVAYPFSDVFLVQHKQLAEKIGKKAIYRGGIL
ncbi:MAG TPA: hypothetical protein VHA12_04325 [Candidatus Nanoarchaeia archaeon]|nr:hypothetical protein [Candidatus Nanoarchaeia archaeon]